MYVGSKRRPNEGARLRRTAPDRRSHLVERSGWANFMEYERKINTSFRRYNLVGRFLLLKRQACVRLPPNGNAEPLARFAAMMEGLPINVRTISLTEEQDVFALAEAGRAGPRYEPQPVLSR
jgi:hypothetical protein